MSLIVDLKVTTTNTQNLLKSNNYAYARIFRKSDNVMMAEWTLPYFNHFDIAFKDYPTCSVLRDVKQTVFNYKLTITLAPRIYADPQGYYLVWERCCRNDDIDNIQSAPNASMVLYAEFPSLRLYPNYSSPTFSLSNNEYVCLNKPFSFKLKATDSDNDQLKYKLVIPINGNNQNQSGSFDNIVVARPYPLINWVVGLSTANSIPADIPLQIDENDGTLEVKPNKTGLYLFTVECADFRNGIQIGLARLDFQFPVVDCSLNTPPTPLVKYKGLEMAEIEHCELTEAILETEGNPAWVFRWQKDGLDIPGAIANTYSTNDEGIYKVIKKLNSVCTDEIESAEVKLTLCEKDLKIFVPTAFSPNQDGKNDELKIFGKNYQ